MLKKIQIIILSLFLIITLNQVLYASNVVNITASFEPKVLAIGQRGLLNITMDNTQSSTAPTLPKVEDLNIVYLGISQSVQITNGKSSMSLKHAFTVTPQKLGTFSLPAFTIESEGKQYPVGATELIVVEKAQAASDEKMITLEVSMDKNEAYVGQMIPIDLTLYASINLAGQLVYGPAIQGNTFIDHGFKENAKSAISNINNVRKQTFQYKTFLTPLESGNLALQYKAGLAIQRPRTRNSHINHFGGLFDNILPATEEIAVESPLLSLSILPLPTHGKPKDFTGAVGQFTLESFTIKPKEVQVGDPMTLKLEVKGTGNFDRISPPVLNTNADWKTYSPKSTINKTDEFAYTGSKFFEYIIIPQSDKITQSPSITFSFFNPQSGLYTELTPDPISLQITPATHSSFIPSLTPLVNTNRNTQALSNKPELLTIKLQISHSVKSLIPLIAKKWFIIISVALTTFISILLFIFKNFKLKKEKDKGYLRTINRQKSIQSNLKQVEDAYLKQDIVLFYDAGTALILELVANQQSQSCQVLTIHDVLEYLSTKPFSDEQLSFVTKFFHTADKIKFSGVATNLNITAENLKKFENLINQLK